MVDVMVMVESEVHTTGDTQATISTSGGGAALTFSMIGLRGLFPGSPPLGILIDKIVYFPALLTTLMCSLFILISWAQREDYVD